MKLLYTTRSPYARKAQVMALEKNIPLELVSVDLTEKPDILINANPLGRIPTLILDDGTALCDSVVICEYLENLKEAPAMFPKNAGACVRTLNLARMADGLMDLTVAIFMEHLLHKDAPSAGLVSSREAGIKRCLQYFQDRLDQLKNFDIAALSVACAIGYIYFRLDRLGPRHGFPELEAWYQLMCERPSMQATMPRA